MRMLVTYQMQVYQIETVENIHHSGDLGKQDSIADKTHCIQVECKKLVERTCSTHCKGEK
jgi:hypothetical protein